MKRILFIITSLMLSLLPLQAQTGQETTASTSESSTDSVVVSLITCSPGSLVYELYGHTAIRVREVRNHRQSDWVFNYGTFSFRQPNFVWRFMLGETDYQLGVLPYAYFYEEYVRSGRAIEEQRLNLTEEEERKLVNALSENLLPENATYRYNFFYDNCTTRAIRAITEAVNGKVAWGEADKGKTLRDIVHEFSDVSPWNSFGQDLLLGAETDRPASLSAQMFAPLYAQRHLAEAQIVGAKGNKRQLADSVVTLLLAQPRADSAEVLTPTNVFAALLLLTVVLTLWEWKRKASFWQFDALLLLAQGLTGCIIAFLFFFSAHPAVGSNYLILLFNPLSLLYFPWFMKQASLGRKAKGLYVQAVLVQLALVAGLCGLQSYPLGVYFIIAVLDLRIVAHFLSIKRKTAASVAVQPS